MTPERWYQAYFFDIDGTLLNTEEGLVFSIMAALKKNGLTLPEDVNIKTFIGPPIQNSFRKTFPSLSDQQIAGLALDFRNDYKTNYPVPGRPGRTGGQGHQFPVAARRIVAGFACGIL